MPKFPYEILTPAQQYLEDMLKYEMEQHPDLDEEEARDNVLGDFMDFFITNVT